MKGVGGKGGLPQKQPSVMTKANTHTAAPILCSKQDAERTRCMVGIEVLILEV